MKEMGMCSRNEIFLTLMEEIKRVYESRDDNDEVSDTDVTDVMSIGLSLGLEIFVLCKREKQHFMNIIEHLVDDGWKKVSKSLAEKGAI